MSCISVFVDVTDLSQSFCHLCPLSWNFCSKLLICNVLLVFNLYVDFIFTFFSCRLSVVTFLSRFLIIYAVLIILYGRLSLAVSVIVYSINISSTFCISPFWSFPFSLFSYRTCMFYCSSNGTLMFLWFLLVYYFATECHTDFIRRRSR